MASKKKKRKKGNPHSLSKLVDAAIAKKLASLKPKVGNPRYHVPKHPKLGRPARAAMATIHWKDKGGTVRNKRLHVDLMTAKTIAAGKVALGAEYAYVDFPNRRK